MTENEDEKDKQIKRMYVAYQQALKRVSESDIIDAGDEAIVTSYEEIQKLRKSTAMSSFKLDVIESRVAIVNKEKKL